MKNLRKIREKNKMTRADFAKKMKVSLTTCQNWENETSKPKKEHLDKINKMFGIVEK